MLREGKKKDSFAPYFDFAHGPALLPIATAEESASISVRLLLKFDLVNADLKDQYVAG